VLRAFSWSVSLGASRSGGEIALGAGGKAQNEEGTESEKLRREASPEQKGGSSHPCSHEPRWPQHPEGLRRKVCSTGCMTSGLTRSFSFLFLTWQMALKSFAVWSQVSAFCD
jgi:hypothetical protein